MTERGTEFDFDFFEEPETQEAPARARPARRRRRPSVGPPGGLTPLLRLIGLIAFAIFLVVVLVFAIQSCRGEEEERVYDRYMDELRPIAGESQRVGRDLTRLLTNRTIRLDGAREQVDGLVERALQDVDNGQRIVPPGHLREQHRQAVDALEFRAIGLERLREAFQTNTRNRRPAIVGRELAADMRRFVASDIVWEDGFRQGTVDVLRREGVTGVEAPRSRFLRNPELATASSLSQSWQRILGTTTGRRGPGPHGNELVSVRALPDGPVLSPDEETVVIADADLALEVTVENSGRSQEVQVRVRLRVEQDRPVDEVQTIPVINPGQRVKVVFRNISNIVRVGAAVPVHVRVEPVPDEERTDNNARTYRVLFRLSP